MGEGHVGYGDTRWLSKRCSGSHRDYNRCHIPHGSVGWVAPHQVATPIGSGFGGGYGAVAAIVGNGLIGGYGGSVVQTAYPVQPHSVPGALWGGSPCWMGTGCVGRDDYRWRTKECRGSRRHHIHCYIRHGSPYSVTRKFGRLSGIGQMWGTVLRPYIGFQVNKH